MNRPSRRALAAAVAALALLAGCSDNPEPAPLEPSASPSTSESPDAAPEMPAEARENTPEGAEAFVRHYFETLNHAFASSDTAPVRSLYAPGCKPCEAAPARIDELHNAGGTISTAGWQVLAASAPRLEIETRTTPVAVRLRISEATVEEPGDPRRTSRASRQSLTVVVRFDDEWKVVDLRLPEENQ